MNNYQFNPFANSGNSFTNNSNVFGNNNYNRTQPNFTININKGIYVYVNDFNDVINYPTSADGTATLFVNLDKGILWSKKFLDGQNSIQAYSLMAINNIVESKENYQTQVKENKPDVEERLDRIEQAIEKLINSNTQKKRKERDIIDEIES